MIMHVDLKRSIISMPFYLAKKIFNSGAVLTEVIEHYKYKETLETTKAEYRSELGLALTPFRSDPEPA